MHLKAVSKYLKQKLTGLKGGINKSMVIVEIFNTSDSRIIRTNRKEIINQGHRTE